MPIRATARVSFDLLFRTDFRISLAQVFRMARPGGTLDGYEKCHASHRLSSPKTRQKMLVQAFIWPQSYSWSEWLPTVSSDRLEENGCVSKSCSIGELIR